MNIIFVTINNRNDELLWFEKENCFFIVNDQDDNEL